MSKLIEQTTVDPKHEIRASEIQQLLHEYEWSKDLVCLINRAFVLGYAIGLKQRELN